MKILQEAYEQTNFIINKQLQYHYTHYTHSTNKLQTNKQNSTQNRINITSPPSMLSTYQQPPTYPNYGRIHPLKWGYYSNPQMCMFSFTLLLTLTFSVFLISYVFVGLYHRIIGSLLCLYVAFRFVSLGFSSPGLAVQFVDQRLAGHEFQTNNEFKLGETQLNAQSLSPQNSSFKQREQHKNYHFHPLIQNSLTKMGFFGYCNECKVPIQHRTKHCKICKTCVDGYDHHCIWIGKCIGKKNMWQFKEFLCFVFVTLIYALILSIQSSKIQRIS